MKKNNNQILLNSNMSKSKKQLPNLGVLRGILALLVVVYHIPLMSVNFSLPSFDAFPIFHKGFNAVWVFFSLITQYPLIAAHVSTVTLIFL